MYRSSAATVCARSPPASCISTIAPASGLGVALRTIAGTPGRAQSLLSLSLSTVRYPRPAASRTVDQPGLSRASANDEYGGRNRDVDTPVAYAIALCVCAYSRL